MESFPSLLMQNFEGDVKHLVRHFIPTEGPPIHARTRRLDGEKLQEAWDEFRKMEEMGVIRRSDSPWASPLHVVPKADGTWWPCGNFRLLNVITKGLARRLAPLHVVLASGQKQKKTVFPWMSDCKQPFEASKRALSDAALPHHPNPWAQSALSVDASNDAVGAELAQCQDGVNWLQIAFFSKRLSPAEKKYSAFDREVLAIYMVIKHFKHFLEGRRVFTDHKPLTFALGSATDCSPVKHGIFHLSRSSRPTSDM